MTRSDLQVLIDNIADGVPNTALRVRTILNALADGTDQTGDIKEIDVSNTYLLANFDATGLGINERVGWAICNGNNGTRDRLGRVGMQYSTSFPILGSIGGEYTHALTISEMPAHTHAVAEYAGNTTGSAHISAPVTTGLQGTSTGSQGGGQSHNNMQPYIVSLFIMKLP